MPANDPEVIHAKKAADRVKYVGSAITVFMLIFVTISERTYFGRPNPKLEETILTCINISYVNNLPQLVINTTNDLWIGRPPTFEPEDVKVVSLYYIYMSQLKPKDPIVFPAMSYSGGGLQHGGADGGIVTYDTTHTVSWGANITDKAATNLLVYDLEYGQLELLAVVNLTFGCNIGTGCRNFAKRFEVRIDLHEDHPSRTCLMLP